MVSNWRHPQQAAPVMGIGDQQSLERQEGSQGQIVPHPPLAAANPDNAHHTAPEYRWLRVVAGVKRISAMVQVNHKGRRCCHLTAPPLTWR